MVRLEIKAVVILTCEGYLSGEEEVADSIIGSEVHLNSLPPFEILVGDRDKHKIHTRFHFETGDIHKALGHKIKADQSDLKEEIVVA